MHPFSGRVCHQNEGVKQERGKPGRNQEGEAPAQEGGEENQQDDSRGKSWENRGAQEKNQSRLEKRRQGSQKGGI